MFEKQKLLSNKILERTNVFSSPNYQSKSTPIMLKTFNSHQTILCFY